MMRGIPVYAFATLAAALVSAGCAGKGSAPRGVDLSRDYSAAIGPMIGHISERGFARCVEDLVAIPTRETGEPGNDEARDYLARRFGDCGWKLSEIAFPALGTTAYNLVAEWPGTDDARAVIVSAHYDSWGEGHSGAVDNATGCAGLVSIAESVAASSARFHRTIRLIAFSCEERGQLGSKDFAKAVDPKLIVAVVNLDAIAPLPTARSSVVYHYRYSKEEIPAWLPELFASVARRYGGSTGIDSASYWDGGGYSFDSRAFEVRGIPATTILGIGDPPANTLSDTIGQVDAAYGRDATRFAAAAVFILAGPVAR